MKLQTLREVLRKNKVFIDLNASGLVQPVDKSQLPYFIPNSNIAQVIDVLCNSQDINIYLVCKLTGDVILNDPNGIHEPGSVASSMIKRYPIYKASNLIKRNVYVKCDDIFKTLRGLTTLNPKRTDNGFIEIDLKGIDLNLPFTNHDVYEFAMLNLLQLYTKAFYKTYNYLYPGFKSDGYKELKTKFSPDVIELLEANGINDNGFHQNSKKKAPLDFIELKISGCSNLPKIEEALSRKDDGKKMTISNKIILAAYQFLKDNSSDHQYLAKMMDIYSEDLDDKIRSIVWSIYASESSTEWITKSGFKQYLNCEYVDGFDLRIKHGYFPGHPYTNYMIEQLKDEIMGFQIIKRNVDVNRRSKEGIETPNQNSL